MIVYEERVKSGDIRIGNNPNDLKSIYGYYWEWCKSNGISPMTAKSLNILLIYLLN